MTTALISPTARPLENNLGKSGFRVLTWPEVMVSAAADRSSLDESIENLFGYDWLILKNEHAAEFFLRRLIETTNHIATLDEIQVLAIGEPTVAKLIDAQAHVDISLDRHRHHALVASLESYLGGEIGRASCRERG